MVIPDSRKVIRQMGRICRISTAGHRAIGIASIIKARNLDRTDMHSRRSAVALALLPLSVQAMQPLVTDDTGTQGAGGKQIEVAYLHQGNCSQLSAGCANSMPITFTYGMAEALDLAVSVTPEQIDNGGVGSSNGNGNTVLGAKYRFIDDESGDFSLALKPEVALPVSNGAEAAGLGTGKTSYALSLLATDYFTWGRMLADLAANRSNYDDPRLDAATRRNGYLASAAVLWVVGDKWQLGGEAGCYTQSDRTLRSTSRFAQLAAIWSPNADTDIAFGIKRDVDTGGADLWTSTVGVTYRF
jgi:hypothetical protein